MATLHLPGGPKDGFRLRESNTEPLYTALNDRVERYEVLINDENHTAQSIVIWPFQLAWFSVQ